VTELAIEAHDLGKDYGANTAVRSVDLEVHSGEFFGFLGPNGAGKTTTIHMLTTLLRPTRGRALVAGHDVVARPLEVRREIGLVFQETTLDGELTAEENLRFAARLYGLSRSETAARVEEVLTLFDLQGRRSDRARTFSGGMRRALDLARGVLHRPRILFLDEPTIGLDPVNRRAVWNYLGRIGEQGTTLFLTTHYLDEADACDRVVIVDHGAIIAQGTPEELKRGLGAENIELEVDDVDQALIDDVRRLSGVEPTRTSRGLGVTVDDTGPALEALLPLVNGRVRSASVRRPSLDDVFVSLIGSAR